MDRAAAEREAARVLGAWSDPENSPPRGKGCWLCHMEPPVVWLDRTALGFNCFARWFPGWSDDRVADWLVSQAEQRVALDAARVGREERDKAALKEWLNS